MNNTLNAYKLNPVECTDDGFFTPSWERRTRLVEYKVHRKAIKILQYNKEKIKVATFHSILKLIKVCCYRIYWINYLNFCAFVCTPILKVYVDDLNGFNWNQQRMFSYKIGADAAIWWLLRRGNNRFQRSRNTTCWCGMLTPPQVI